MKSIWRTVPATGNEGMGQMKQVMGAAWLIGWAAVVLGSSCAFAETVTVATEADYPPFSKTEADGRYTGFEIDLGNAVCAKAKLDCKWVKQEFSGMIPGLMAKKFDMIFSSMSITPERAAAGLFSKPYLADQFRFYGPKGHDIAFPEGLDGKRVGVFAGSSGEQFIKARWGDKVETSPYQNIDQVNADLDAGRIDYGFNGQLPVSTFLKSANGAGDQWYGPSYSDPILGKGAGAMLRKDETALAAKVNEGIAAVYADGTFDKLSQSYFGPQIDIRADKLW